MLLLLFLNPDTYKIPVGNFSCLLGDLFDVNMGIIEDRYQKMTKEGSDVYVLNLKSFTNNDSVKETQFINRYDQYNLLDFKKVLSTKGKSDKNSVTFLEDAEKPFISEKKLLTKNDYLITIRGQPKGYSILRSYENKEFKGRFPNIVATNHFVRLRPKIVLDMHIPYLHLLLDSIVENQLRNLFEQKKENLPKDKKYGVFNSFSVEELKEMQITFSRDVNQQIVTTELFEKNYQKYFDATIYFNEFKEQLNRNITTQLRT
jgi:hypothetical protein